MPSYALPLTTLGTVSSARNADGTYGPGTNKLNWAVPPTTAAGDPQTFAWRALFLQRSINIKVSDYTGVNHVSTISAGLARQVPGIDARWTTIRTWATAELPQGSWPLEYSESAPHTTWYYYRLVYMGRANADGTGAGIQYTWNPATIVQPGVLNIGDPACGSGMPKRLCWDAPLLYDDHFNFNLQRATDPAYKWSLRWSWPFVVYPSSFDLYKSYDGIDYGSAVAHPVFNAQPFLDSDPAPAIWYKLVAHTADNHVSTYDIVSGTLP